MHHGQRLDRPAAVGFRLAGAELRPARRRRPRNLGHRFLRRGAAGRRPGCVCLGPRRCVDPATRTRAANEARKEALPVLKQRMRDIAGQVCANRSIRRRPAHCAGHERAGRCRSAGRSARDSACALRCAELSEISSRCSSTPPRIRRRAQPPGVIAAIWFSYAADPNDPYPQAPADLGGWSFCTATTSSRATIAIDTTTPGANLRLCPLVELQRHGPDLAARADARRQRAGGCQSGLTPLRE